MASSIVQPRNTQSGVQEYWQLGPKGEWIPEQARDYTLHEFINSDREMEPVYEAIANNQS